MLRILLFVKKRKLLFRYFLFLFFRNLTHWSWHRIDTFKTICKIADVGSLIEVHSAALLVTPLQYSLELQSWSIDRCAFSLLNLVFTQCSFFVIKFAELKLHLFKAYTKSARKIQVKICDSEQLSTSFSGHKMLMQNSYLF